MIINGHELSSGDVALVDIDGYLTIEKRPDGSIYYPEFGPIKQNGLDILNILRDKGVQIHIWTARLNERDINKWKRTLKEDIESVRNFLIHNNIPYDQICFHFKPIGTHYAKVLFDDRTHNGY